MRMRGSRNPYEMSTSMFQRDHDQRDEDDDAGDHRQVELVVRDQELPSDSGQVEDRLDEDRRCEREADVHAQDGDHGQHAGSRRVSEHHPPLRCALCARRAHVVLTEPLDHLRTDHPHVERGEADGEGEPGQHHVVGPLPESSAILVLVGEGVAVARDRRPAELEAEDPGEHQPEPDGLARDPDQHEDHRQAVEQRARTDRRHDPDGNRHGQVEDRTADDQRPGHGQARLDQRVDALQVDVGDPERLVGDHVPDEAPVLFPDRLVQMQQVPDAEDRLRAGTAAGGERRGVIRDQEEDRVGDDRGSKDEEDRPEHAPDYEPRHPPPLRRRRTAVAG